MMIKMGANPFPDIGCSKIRNNPKYNQKNKTYGCFYTIVSIQTWIKSTAGKGTIKSYS
jgi:hypothetical protein